MAQAFLKVDAVLTKDGSEPEPTAATSFWLRWECTFVGPEVSYSPTMDRIDAGPGMANCVVDVRVDQGDTGATFGARLRAGINAAATARGFSVPANQVLVPSHQRA